VAHLQLIRLQKVRRLHTRMHTHTYIHTHHKNNKKQLLYLNCLAISVSNSMGSESVEINSTSITIIIVRGEAKY